MKLDLSIMREFAELAGNPHEGMHFAHIAGTNGKGSAASFLYQIMRRNYSTGLYTSPHILRFNERIVVDDREIEDEYIVNFVRKYRPYIENLAKEMRNPTFFEVTTTLAFKYFRDKNVDFAVIEVGLGGRLDATNIIIPEITAITSIDREHTNVLGKSISKIASEKAGIIKPEVPVIVGERKKEAIERMKKIAERRNAEYHNVWEECSFDDLHISIDGMQMLLRTPAREYRVKTKMLGRHQISNIMVATRMAELLQENYTIRKRDIEKGIEKTMWRGRFEIKRKKPLLIFDAAHNPAGARVLADTLKELNLKNLTLLFSMLDDKNVEKFLIKLRGRVRRVVVCEIDYYRKMPAEKLKEIAERYFDEVIVIKNSCEALKSIMNENVLATGSIYLLGELERCLQSSL